MLVLTRSEGESIIISDNIQIVVSAVKSNQVRLLIDAPKNVSIIRPDAKNKEPKVKI